MFIGTNLVRPDTRKWGVGTAEGPTFALWRKDDTNVGEIITELVEVTNKTVTWKNNRGKKIKCSFRTLSAACCTDEVADFVKVNKFNGAAKKKSIKNFKRKSINSRFVYDVYKSDLLIGRPNSKMYTTYTNLQQT